MSAQPALTPHYDCPSARRLSCCTETVVAISITAEVWYMDQMRSTEGIELYFGIRVRQLIDCQLCNCFLIVSYS